VAFDRRIDPGILEGSNISKVEACGDKWRIYTEDPDKALETILAVKEREGLRVLSIATCGPSLEDVFVKICEVPR
jgi:ABC-2 type transport system ATP-binding protein